jgi:pimeloyl-ACP methyl ester carboxylesterase
MGPMSPTPPPIESLTHTLPHGIDLSCRVAGPVGAPVLLFVHGFPEAAFVWDGLLQHFAAPHHGGYRCVAPNLRGYERSSAPTDVAQYRAKHLMQDLQALIALEAGPSKPLVALVAHDWGGAVAWGLAATQPQCMERLCIINSPHPATFLRELQHSPQQQAASAYMNFLARPDAPELLAQDDFRRLWVFFEGMGASDGPHPWLTPELRQRYRELWSMGLQGPCHYYGASPLRPATDDDANLRGLSLPDALCRVDVPTQVIWGLNDTALPPSLLDGLDHWVPQLRVDRVADATHWLIHEQPERVQGLLREFLKMKQTVQ